MNRTDLLNHCLSLPASTSDCPFGEDFDSVVCRHSASRKWFALIMDVKGRDGVNLRCEPDKALFWQSVYKDVIPAYHMNKRRWITVFFDGDVADAAFFEMADDSFALTLTPKDKIKQ